jgi:hypothetical protein
MARAEFPPQLTEDTLVAKPHPRGNIVNVRFATAFPRCNYSCTYCIAGHGEVFPARESRWDPERYERIVENLTRLRFPFNIRLGVAGEFFLDRTLIDGARRLSTASQTVSINLITNLSFRYRQYKALMAGFREDKIAIVASFHPSEVKDHDAWLETATAMAADYDFAAVLVAYPPLLGGIAGYRAELLARGIETFVQPFIGVLGTKSYPRDYSAEERSFLRGIMYSRHDVEYLLNLKKPGLCKAGFRSIFVNPEGLVFPCGMGTYSEPLGNLAEGPDLKLRADVKPCPFQACQCDTENINTVQFGVHYERDSANQHKYRYRFREAALADHHLDEWEIDY